MDNQSLLKIINGTLVECDDSVTGQVVIPDSVKIIDYGAFDRSRSLTSVVIPNSVTTISGSAFFCCDSLTNIKIGDNIAFIGSFAFSKCKGLKTSRKNYKAVKIQNEDFICRDLKYKLNEWSQEIDNPEICRQGYHYCTNLFEIFNYYSGELDKDIAIFECEVGDKIDTSDTSKCCTNKIKLVKRLYREDVIKILNGEDKEIEK